MNSSSSLDYARQRDAADPVGSFRAGFALPEDAAGRPLLYLCGHSLGLMPLAARSILTEELDDWARLGVRGHEEARRAWIYYPENLRADLAGLVGCAAEEVVAMNSLTINLHLMLASFYRRRGVAAGSSSKRAPSLQTGMLSHRSSNGMGWIRGRS